MPRWAAPYLFVQAAGVAGWWIALCNYPELRTKFFHPGQDLRAFMIADLATYVIFGALAAIAILRANRRALYFTGILFGGAFYATAWTIADWAGWIGPALMILSTIVSGYVFWRTVR